PGLLKGRLGICSPEQARGERVDGRSDLFSLAVMASEMLIGKALFQGDSALQVYERLARGDLSMLHAYGTHVPDDVKAMLGRALEVDRDRRYPDAASFMLDVQWLVQRHGLELESYGFSEWMADLGLIALESNVNAVPPWRKPNC